MLFKKMSKNIVTLSMIFLLLGCSETSNVVSQSSAEQDLPKLIRFDFNTEIKEVNDVQETKINKSEIEVKKLYRMYITNFEVMQSSKESVPVNGILSTLFIYFKDPDTDSGNRNRLEGNTYGDVKFENSNNGLGANITVGRDKINFGNFYIEFYKTSRNPQEVISTDQVAIRLTPVSTDFIFRNGVFEPLTQSQTFADFVNTLKVVRTTFGSTSPGILNNASTLRLIVPPEVNSIELNAVETETNKIVLDPTICNYQTVLCKLVQGQTFVDVDIYSILLPSYNNLPHLLDAARINLKITYPQTLNYRGRDVVVTIDFSDFSFDGPPTIFDLTEVNPTL
jgi:hypothetical protein